MKHLLILLLLLAHPAQAQTRAVSVKSGDHRGFTRLVLTFPAPVDWVLGRTESGYGLQIAGPDLPYDLSSVYRVISKDRLRSIWVDPATGNLLLGVDCPCHAIPFELGSKTLVIDIKDGAPPRSSSFELRLTDGTISPPLQQRSRQATPAQRRREVAEGEEGYDWLSREAGTAQPAAAAVPTQVATEAATAGLEADLTLEDFRSMLIEEVGRGATEGVVEMETPAPPQIPPQDAPVASLPENARAAVNALPGIELSSDTHEDPDLMVKGEACPKAAELDLGSWSGSGDAASELAQARAAVLTEFDQPDPVRVTRAVNTHLHFGFGAEARLLLTTFMPQGQTDPLRIGLSYLVDGDHPPANAFDTMQSCDSAAALWALLAAPGDQVLPYVNGAAVSRTFLSLPATLRATLGPETVKRLLASGDSANAEVVRQSFERAVPADDPSVNLLAAEQALQNGDPAGAEAALPTAAMGEAAMTSLFTLVEARFVQRKAVEGKDILALEAFAFEQGDGPLRPQMDRALTHAKALSGDFAAAFAHASDSAASRAGLEQDIWMLLGEIGAESHVLDFAVGLDPQRRAALPLTTRTQIAARLTTAGLPNAASDWAQSDDFDPDLAARIALANGDARTALQLLSARLPDADPELIAASHTALGQFDTAAATYRDAGKLEEAARLQRWAGIWPAPAESATDAPAEAPPRASAGLPAALPPDGTTLGTENSSWEAVAGLLDPPADQNALPPLQAGQARLNQSAATRQAVAALLAAAPLPDPP